MLPGQASHWFDYFEASKWSVYPQRLWIRTPRTFSTVAALKCRSFTSRCCPLIRSHPPGAIQGRYTASGVKATWKVEVYINIGANTWGILGIKYLQPLQRMV